jgi:TPR repeat protein
MMLDGIGGPPDPQAAARLFDRACIGAYADSCVHLAWMGRGDRGRDPLRWLERACDLDDACVVLGEVHELGMVEGAKLGAAAEAYQRGCAADRPDACFRLGGVLSRGAGVARDDAAAARLYQVACEGGHAQACTALARAYEVGAGVHADAAATAHYRKRACTLDPAEGCR